MGVGPTCMPRVSNAEVEVGESSPFQEVSLPLDLESRPMEPAMTRGQRAIGSCATFEWGPSRVSLESHVRVA